MWEHQTAPIAKSSWISGTLKRDNCEASMNQQVFSLKLQPIGQLATLGTSTFILL